MNGYRISTDYEEMNLSVVHGFISKSSWAKGIPMETMARAVKNSLCFGVFARSGEQVGFARMITDAATFAYLADVFILEAHRGQGLSKWLMAVIMAHPQLQGLRRMVLATADAHGLYGKFGFTPLARSASFMELWLPEVYSAV